MPVGPFAGVQDSSGQVVPSVPSSEQQRCAGRPIHAMNSHERCRLVTNNREILGMLCAVALAAAVGCSTSPPPEPVGEPGKAGALPVLTKELPKGAKLGQGKALVH